MHDHQRIRKQLETRLAVLSHRIHRIETDLRHEDRALYADHLDKGAALGNDDVLSALDQAGRQELAEIQAILRRMDLGSYGWCIECGEPIDVERLVVLPYTSTCFDCANTQQRVIGG